MVVDAHDGFLAGCFGGWRRLLAADLFELSVWIRVQQLRVAGLRDVCAALGDAFLFHRDRLSVSGTQTGKRIRRCDTRQLDGRSLRPVVRLHPGRDRSDSVAVQSAARCHYVTLVLLLAALLTFLAIQQPERMLPSLLRLAAVAIPVTI